MKPRIGFMCRKQSSIIWFHDLREPDGGASLINVDAYGTKHFENGN